MSGSSPSFEARKGNSTGLLKTCASVPQLLSMSELRTVEWVNGKVRVIDQTRLPDKFTYVTYRDYRYVAKAIKNMVVRSTGNRRSGRDGFGFGGE